MSLDLPVRIKKNNSIKEATITLFLANKLFKPERFKELINDESLSGFFQQHQPISEITFKFGNLTENTKSETNIVNDTGFKLLKFDHGVISFVTQGVNEAGRTFFSFHDLNYSRWVNFKNNYGKILEALLRIQSDTFINGVSLHYVDEFVWSSEEEFDLSKIMKAEEFLPQNFIKIRGGHLSNTRQCETINNLKLFDRLEVLVDPSIEKLVTISHNQTVLLDNVIELKSIETKGILDNLLNELHENNKKLLRGVLLDNVKKLIKLD